MSKHKKRKQKKPRNLNVLALIVQNKSCIMRDRRLRRSKEKEDFSEELEDNND
jgi:hypothetical protein